MTRKPFHRSDFTGSEGPGMAKLRAARPSIEPLEPCPRCGAAPGHVGDCLAKQARGLDAVKSFMSDGLWIDAILVAAKFPDLGDQAEAIQRGREAIMRPQFMRQLKRDPQAAIEAAKKALLERWPL